MNCQNIWPKFQDFDSLSFFLNNFNSIDKQTLSNVGTQVAQMFNFLKWHRKKKILNVLYEETIKKNSIKKIRIFFQNLKFFHFRNHLTVFYDKINFKKIEKK